MTKKATKGSNASLAQVLQFDPDSRSILAIGLHSVPEQDTASDRNCQVGWIPNHGLSILV
jgi:hypothetical protein